MKRLAIIALAAAAVVSFQAAAIAEDVKDKVVAYYFHGKFRCRGCLYIEELSRKAIEDGFKDAIDSGRLEFRAVNVEEKGNEHYIKDYKLYTKSLVLSLVKGGKEASYKNLTRIWELARNPKEFDAYVKREVEKFLSEVE